MYVYVYVCICMYMYIKEGAASQLYAWPHLIQ